MHRLFKRPPPSRACFVLGVVLGCTPATLPPTHPPRTPRPEVELPEPTVLDESDVPEATDEPEPPAPHPLEHYSLPELEELLQTSPETLGPVAVGTPNSGALINATQLPDDPRWVLMSSGTAWATDETITYLGRAIDAVHEEFPQTPPLFVGDLSRQKGGHLSPHVSHQSGCDVDISFYYAKDAAWYRRGTRTNLDLPRTWAFVRALITQTDLRFVLIDSSIQQLLYDYALEHGEDAAWLKDVFKGTRGQRAPLIRYAPGHATHLHARFYNPTAQASGHRLHGLLVKHGWITPPLHYAMHKVKKGETLIHLARTYGISVKEIMQANHLRSTVIQARKVYRIPQRGTVESPGVEIPPRRVPPASPSPMSRGESSEVPGSGA